MEQKKENKVYVGSSYKTEFDTNGVVTGVVFNFEVNIQKIKETIPDFDKKKEIVLNIEKRVSPHQKEDIDGNKVDVPLEEEAKMPGYNVYIGDMHNSHRELAVFLKTENLMSLPMDEKYGNVKITAATRTTKGFDMSSFMVYENPGKNAEKVIGENGKIVRNFIGRGYSAAENFGNDKNNNIIGTANKFIFNDEETEQRTGKAYNLAIDPDKINSLKVNEYGQAKVALIQITETGVNEKGDAVEKK